MKNELESYIESYFGIIEPEELKIISALFKSSSLKKGDYYLKAGRESEELSFIVSGIMRVFVYAENKEITQWIATEGNFVTDLSSFIFETTARWTIQSLNDVELFTISKADYNRIGNLIPNWHQLEKLFIVKCFSMMEDRIYSHLSMTAEERYLHFFNTNKELFNQVPLQYIASMLGMSAETLSRIRKKTLK